MELTFFPITGKKGKIFIAKHTDGKTVICSDPELKQGNTVILTLSDNGEVYFANVKENGITCKVQ